VRTAPALVSLLLALGATATARAESDVPPPPKPWLGIGFHEEQFDYPVVSDVHPGTGAASAGLQPNDRILAIDGIDLGPGMSLVELMKMHKVGDRLTLIVERRARNRDRRVRLTPRLTAMPTTDEIIYRRLFDRALPALTLFDRDGAQVPAAEWTRRPQVWVLFDAGCDRCAGAVASLQAQLAAADDGAAEVPLRAIILGRHEELGAFLARIPVLGTVWRTERGDPEDRAMAYGIYRYFLSGIEDTSNDGVMLVVDHRGIVRFATSISAGDAALEGACAAAARAARAWRP
jgi:hypothetical protein